MNTRRNFLTKAASAGIGLPLLGPLAFPGSRINAPRITGTESLPKVRVSEERVIRTVVGLRPYRKTGFRLESERMAEKTVIHNYGHGGGGISLSWGTSQLAVNLCKAQPGTQVAVMGCGVMGLSTAILAQRRGLKVSIYTREMPPNTTSNVAGAQWSPGTVFDTDKVDSAFIATYERASAIAYRKFQDLAGARYGVQWIPNYFLGYEFDFPGGRNLYAQYQQFETHQSPFNEKTDVMTTMMIEPQIYLRALLDDFMTDGGKLLVREFHNTNAIIGLAQSTIFNCTGLGSHKLFGDNNLMPIKGQLTVLLPQPEIQYAYISAKPGDLLYMFPRQDGIILGGTFDDNNWSLEPDGQEAERILRGHARVTSQIR